MGRPVNFKLGMRMEYDDLHHWTGQWPPSWMLWSACKGREHIVVATLQAAQLVLWYILAIWPWSYVHAAPRPSLIGRQRPDKIRPVCHCLQACTWNSTWLSVKSCADQFKDFKDDVACILLVTAIFTFLMSDVSLMANGRLPTLVHLLGTHYPMIKKHFPQLFSFYPRDAMRKRGYCYSHVSVTRRYCIETDKDIKLFSRPCSPTTMVF